MSAPSVPPVASDVDAVLPTYARYPVEIVDGDGCLAIARDGRSYLDFTSGVAVNALGHRHPAVTAAIRAAATRPVHVSNLFWNAPMVRLAERLADLAGLDAVFFGNSGAESIETALKIAMRARPERRTFVAFDRAFHGRTTGALALAGNAAYREPFGPAGFDVRRVPFGDADRAACAIDEDVAAVFVEAVQGEGGVHPAPPGFLAALRAACDRAGALLVIDEVQTGTARTGPFFAYLDAGITPDVACVAKGLGGGFPIGAAIAGGTAARALRPGDHGSTFGGGPFVTSLAHAVVDVVADPAFAAAVVRAGERLVGGLRRTFEDRPDAAVAVRGRGLLVGIERPRPDAAKVVELARDDGLLLTTAGPSVVRFAPPLVVSDDEIDTAVRRLDRAFRLADNPGHAGPE